MVNIGYKKVFFLFIATILSLVMAFLCVKVDVIAGLGFALIPFVFLAVIIILNKPFYGLILAFIINYFAIGLIRYIPAIQPGILFDITLLLVLFSLLVNTAYSTVDWKRGINVASMVALIWTLYCLFEFFNPAAISNKAWMITVRGVGVYIFAIIFFTSIICKKYEQMKTIIFLWGLFSLIATAKALIQKYVGFDTFEKIWLYRDGGATTHIINSGIRYFSFFSDAANFGSAMGHALVVFTGVSFFEKKKSKKIFYIIVAVASLYSMLISGTRASLAVPIVGFAVYVFLSKNVKTFLICAVALIGVVVFFRFTTIGQGNSIIRRTRTAFFPTEDASYLVRLANQQLLKDYLRDKPFGAGIGHGGVKAKKPTNYSYLSSIPTDSWFVMIWVETGIVGLILNLAVMITILIYCSYIVFFKIKDKQLRGILASLLSGIVGIMAASYANEILGQFPTNTLVYMSIAFIIMGKQYDKALADNN